MKVTYDTLEEAEAAWANYAQLVVSYMAKLVAQRHLDYEVTLAQAELLEQERQVTLARAELLEQERQVTLAQAELLEQERQACGQEVERLKRDA